MSTARAIAGLAETLGRPHVDLELEDLVREAYGEVPQIKAVKPRSLTLNTPERVLEAEQYFVNNATKRYFGKGLDEYFTDDAGIAWRTNQKPPHPKTGQPVFSWYNQDAKNQRNGQISKQRREAGEVSTEGKADFYTKRSDPGADAHHIAELERTSKLFKGLSPHSRSALFKYLKKRGIVTGDSQFNRAEISKKMHNAFHSWFNKKYGTRGPQIDNLSLTQRKKYIDEFLAMYQDANQKLFSMRQSELKIKGRKGSRRASK